MIFTRARQTIILVFVLLLHGYCPQLMAQKGMIAVDPIFFYDTTSPHDIKTLAQQNGATLQQLKSWNLIVGDDGALPSGVRLLVGFMSSDERRKQQLGDHIVSRTKVKLADEEQIEADGIVFERIYHTVAKGQSLLGISRQHNLTVYQLKEWNHLATTSLIKPGDKLVVGFKPIKVEKDSIRLLEIVDEAAIDSSVLVHHKNHAHLHANKQYIGHESHPTNFSDLSSISKVLVVTMLIFIFCGVAYFAITNYLAKRAAKAVETEPEEE